MQLSRAGVHNKSSGFKVFFSVMSDSEYEVIQTIHISLSHDISKIVTTAVRERHKKKNGALNEVIA